MSRLLSVTISALCIGHIWMPNIVASYPVEATFTPEGVGFDNKWEGLHDALDTVYMKGQGNFRSCGLYDAVITVRKHDGSKALEWTKTVTGKVFNEFAADIEDIEAYEQGQFGDNEED